MTTQQPLFLYLAELLLDCRLSINATRKQLVVLHNTHPTGDPILDECLEIIKASKKRASLQPGFLAWLVSKTSGTKSRNNLGTRRLPGG